MFVVGAAVVLIRVVLFVGSTALLIIGAAPVKVVTGSAIGH